MFFFYVIASAAWQSHYHLGVSLRVGLFAVHGTWLQSLTRNRFATGRKYNPKLISFKGVSGLKE